MRQNAVKNSRVKQNSDARAGWKGLFLAAILYLILSVKQPTWWSVPLWALLAFLVVPGSVGLLVGRKLGEANRVGSRFWTGANACGHVMFCYTVISLTALHSRIQSGGDSTQVFFVGIFVSVVYAIIAASVAGTISVLAGSRKQKVGGHEPAS